MFVNRPGEQPGSRSWIATIATLTATALVQATTVATGFVRFATDAEVTAGTSVSAAVSVLTAAKVAGLHAINSLTGSLAATDVEDTDVFHVSDTSDSNTGKKISAFNLRAWLASPETFAGLSSANDGDVPILGNGKTTVTWGPARAAQVGKKAFAANAYATNYKATGITLTDLTEDDVYQAFLVAGKRNSVSWIFSGADFAAQTAKSAGDTSTGIAGDGIGTVMFTNAATAYSRAFISRTSSNEVLMYLRDTALDNEAATFQVLKIK